MSHPFKWTNLSRFANSKRLVFKNTFEMHGPLTAVLEKEIQLEYENRHNAEAANTNIRKRGAESRELKGRVEDGIIFVVVLHWSSHKVALSLYSSICQLFYFLKFWEIPSPTPFKGMFCNQWTLSLLAGLCDIYNAYGNLVNVVHMFRLFPHQRYEKFLSELAKMRQISDHITESNCSNKTCPLKFHHGAKKSLESGDWTNSSCWCLSNKRCWNEHRN